MDLIAFRTKYEKQWRHSYKASYTIFTTKYFESDDGQNEQKLVGNIDDVWYFAFEPTPKALDVNDKERRKFLFVDETKNLHYGDVTTDGLNTESLTEDTQEGIYNGVPDWVYEEEMLASRSASWWSPNGDNIVFIKFNTTMEENVEYNYYARSDDQAARADDFLISGNEDRYPQVERIPYSKPGGDIASYEVWFCSGLVEGDKDPCQEVKEVSGLTNNDLFARIDFINDVHNDQSNTDIKSLFYITTQNRIGSASSYLQCYYLDSKLECEPIAALDESTAKDGEFTGWVDSAAMMNDPYIGQNWLFRIGYKFEDCNSLQAYNKDTSETVDLIDGEGVCIQSVHSIGRPVRENELTTDYSIRFYASVPEKSWERHVYQINYKPLVEEPNSWKPVKFADWQCLTCQTFEERQCTYGGLSLSTDRDFGVFSCYGPEVPYYLNIHLPQLVDGQQEVIIPGITDDKKYPLVEETIETNSDLIADLQLKKWPR